MRPITVLAVLLLALLLTGHVVSQDTDAPDASGDDNNASNDPEDTTATGNPVIAANTNEIRTIQDDDAPAGNLDAAEAQKELRETMELERQKRAERLQKHAEEETLKTAESEKKSNHRQNRKDKTEAQLKKSKEDGSKSVAEEERKGELRYNQGLEHSRSKQQVKLQALKTLDTVNKAKLRAEKKAWEMKVAVDKQQLEEERQKDHEQKMKSQAEDSRKKKYEEEGTKRHSEMRTKNEEFSKQQQTDAQNRQARNNNRAKQQEANTKQARQEENRKADKAAKDLSDEMEGKNTRRVDEQNKKNEKVNQKRKEVEAENQKALNTFRSEFTQKASQTEQHRQKRKEKELEEDNKNAQERKQKGDAQRVRDQDLRWCNCQWQAVNWEANNQWFNCPANTLVIGMFRQQNQDLSALQHYRCCGACGPDGGQRSLERCYTHDWVRSFDYAGWSMCSGGAYINGFYKSSCNWIYCLEYAHCCSIQGSPGARGCSAKGSWGHEFDYAGWKFIDANLFMNGLYRSGGHWLYNIEYPHQCSVRAA